MVNRSTILIEGQRVYSGVVQVCVNGKYGYVCANDWGNKEADVVCRSNYYSPPPFFGKNILLRKGREKDFKCVCSVWFLCVLACREYSFSHSSDSW